MKIAVLVSGGGTNLQAIIDAIDSKKITNAEIAVVISSREGAFALERAKRRGIPAVALPRKAYSSPEDFDRALMREIDKSGAGLVVLAGFLSVLGSEFCRKYENRIINVHPSLIPAFCGKGYYGLKVHEKVLEYGVKVTGATVHFVNEIPDGGPIILQKAVYVEPDDTPESLQKRVMEQAEWEILPKAVDLFVNGRIKIEGRKTIILE